MMQSSDEDNHYIAMQAILNLGNLQAVEIAYKEELLFLWLHSSCDIKEWREIAPPVAEMFRKLLHRFNSNVNGVQAQPSKRNLKYKGRWLIHLLGASTSVNKPYIAELVIEELIKEHKQVFNALDFEYKEIQVKITQ